MQQLSNLDAAFLHLENDHSPMHVGGVMIFDAPAEGRMTQERLREHVYARLQTARVFRQRLLMPAWSLEAPWWVEDENFNLDNHLSHLTVDGPIDPAGLQALSADFFSKPLQRDRPLWELLFVEPAATARRRAIRKGGAFALLLKVHHAALDGVSAEAVLAGLLDVTPTPRELPRDVWVPEIAPSRTSLALHGVRTVVQWRGQADGLWQSARQLGQRFLQRTVAIGERTLPYFFTAPATPLNVPIGAGRQYGTAELSLPRIKQIKNRVPGLTVNDVVLAICAGAVRRYLQEDGAMPERSLVAMAPVSKRTTDQKGALGNKVSAMLIRLATDIDDPVLRLQQIHENARLAKDYSREMTMETLFDQLPHVATAHFLSRYAQRDVARRMPPMFNLIITNVPGSPVPLYLDGAMMRGFSGMAGIYDGMALTLVVLSYCDTVSIGMTSTPEVLRDPQRLAGYLAAALEELDAAMQQADTETGASAAVLPAARAG